MKRRHAGSIALMVTIIIAVNLYLLDIPNNAAERETILVTRVIDGDTIEAGDESIRLLNINTPERNRPGYEEAKNYLAQLENTTVEIQRSGTDKYGRTLARLYDSEYINLKIVESGLGTKYLVQEEELKEFARAEQKAIQSEKGIWHHSIYFGCFKADIEEREEIVTIESACGEIDFSGWKIKDESRKEYNVPRLISQRIILYTTEGNDEGEILYWNSGTDVWNNERDTFYLFDAKNNLAHALAYGY